MAAKPETSRRSGLAGLVLAGAAVSILQAALAVAQPANAVGLTEAVQPPTRVFPGDEIELIVLDPARFPREGQWTIAERLIEPADARAGAGYSLPFTLPADFPESWDRLPIEYADPGGQVLYDSRLDARPVGLAAISDPAPFREGVGRLTGSTPAAAPGERFCVCGFFPNPTSRAGLLLDGAALNDPISATGTELWFLMPDVEVGTHEIGGDPAAGYGLGEPVTIETSATPTDLDPPCPCARESAFLADDVETGPPVEIRPPPPAEEEREPPVIWLESLGGSTGEVFTAHLVGADSGPIEVDGLFAVEPVALSPEEKERVLASVRQVAGSHADVNVNFYCLQFGALAPPEGVVYRLASADKQARFQPAARALAAARRLYESNQLSPDTRPDGYFHSIRQWSVWTLEQGFDREGFVSAFTELAKKNVEEAGQEWSEEFASRVQQSAEGRWVDITKVLIEAGAGSAVSSEP